MKDFIGMHFFILKSSHAFLLVQGLSILGSTVLFKSFEIANLMTVGFKVHFGVQALACLHVYDFREHQSSN